MRSPVSFVLSAAWLMGTAVPLVAQSIAALSVAPPAVRPVDRDTAPAHGITGLRLAWPVQPAPIAPSVESSAARAAAAPYGLALRAVGAGVLATLISVDNAREWRRCEDHYPQPYPAYDRALGRPFYDGVCLPRWQHHLARVLVANTTAAVAHDGLGLSELPSAILTSLVVGGGPHILSHIHRPDGDPAGTVGDAVTDAWFASMPLASRLPRRVGGRWVGLALWAGGYALLYPYARP